MFAVSKHKNFHKNGFKSHKVVCRDTWLGSKGLQTFCSTLRRVQFLQPNATHRKVQTLWTHKPTQSNSIQPTTNLLAQERQYFNISQLVKVYQVGYYSFNSIYHYQIMYIGVPSFRIFGNVSDTRPNSTHQKAKNLDRTQPNPWVDTTNGQLWLISNLFIF